MRYIHEVAQDVDVVVPVIAGHLNAGDYLHAEMRAGLHGLGHAVDAVVVGDGDGGQTKRGGLLRQGGGAVGAVGGGGMEMQINTGHQYSQGTLSGALGSGPKRLGPR